MELTISIGCIRENRGIDHFQLVVDDQNEIISLDGIREFHLKGVRANHLILKIKHGLGEVPRRNCCDDSSSTEERHEFGCREEEDESHQDDCFFMGAIRTDIVDVNGVAGVTNLTPPPAQFMRLTRLK